MTEAAGRQRNKELFQGAVVAKQGISLDVWQRVRSSVCQENPQEGAAPRGQTVQSSMLGIPSKLCYRLHCGTRQLHWNAGPRCAQGQICAVLARVRALNGEGRRVILNKPHLVGEHGSSRWRIVQAASARIDFEK